MTTPPTFEERLDALTYTQRAFIATSLDAFEATLPVDGNGVSIEDLDNDTLAQLTAACDALPEQSLTAAESAGRAIAARYYLHRTGNPALPHTCAAVLRLYSEAEMDDGPCPECHRIGAHEGICAGPAPSDAPAVGCDAEAPDAAWLADAIADLMRSSDNPPERVEVSRADASCLVVRLGGAVYAVAVTRVEP